MNSEMLPTGETETEAYEERSGLGNANTETEKEVTVTVTVTVPPDPLIQFADDKIEVAKLMECIRCAKINHPKHLHSCSNSHVICTNCLDQIGGTSEGICPNVLNSEGGICHGAFSPHISPIYNLVFNNSLFKCPFTQFGCEEQVFGKDLENHEQNCTFRPTLQCPFSDCSQFLTKLAILDHVKSIHSIPNFEIDVGSAELRRISVQAKNKAKNHATQHHQWICAILTCNGLGVEFMLMAEESELEFRLWISLLSLGEISAAAGQKFLWTIAPVTLPNRPGKLSGSGKVFSFDGDFEDVKKDSEYFTMPKISFRKNYVFKKEGLNFWEVDIKIKARQAQNIHS